MSCACQASCGRISAGREKAPRGNAGQKGKLLNRRRKNTPPSSRSARASLTANQKKLFVIGQRLVAKSPVARSLLKRLSSAGCDYRELCIAVVQAAYAEASERRSTETRLGKRRPALTFERFLQPPNEKRLRSLPKRIRDLAAEIREIQRSIYQVPAEISFRVSGAGADADLPAAAVPKVLDSYASILALVVKGQSRSSEKVKHTFLSRANLVRLVAERVTPLPYEDLSNLINSVVSVLLDSKITVIGAKALEQTYRRYKTRKQAIVIPPFPTNQHS